MKALSIEEKARAYDEALIVAKQWYNDSDTTKKEKYLLKGMFSELVESDDERIRESLLEYLHTLPNHYAHSGVCAPEWIAWLEKQGETSPILSNSSNIGKDALSEEEQNRFAKGVLTSCAMSFIDYLDAHKYEGKMCVSNGECEDIENAFHNAMWDRLHRYYCKYIEKQGEQKSVAKYKVGDTVYYDSFGRLVSFVIANIVEDGTDNPMYEDKDGNSVFQNDIVEQKPSDKVEPKFKVGDWVVYEGKKGNKNNRYCKKEELKIKDVMVGDWVDVRNDATPNTTHLERITPSHFLRDEHWYGVELVPEILEKNGFTKSTPPSGIHAKCYELDNKKDKYNLTIADYNKYKRLLLNVDSEDSECFNIKCDYVHELQHALRLCRIEKEIEL